jgi:hypothetical protein
MIAVIIAVLFAIVGFQQTISNHLEYLQRYGADENNI